MLRYLCSLNNPNIQAQSGPDGEVSVITGSPNAGSKPFSAQSPEQGQDQKKAVIRWVLTRQVLATHRAVGV